MNRKKSLFFSFLLLALTSVAYANADDTVATYKGGKVSDEEVMKYAKRSIMKPLAQIYRIKRGVVENLIAEDLLDKEAQEQKTTVAKLLEKNVTRHVKDPTESELKALFEQRKNSRGFHGKTFEDMKNVLVSFYKQDKTELYTSKYLDTLYEKYDVAIHLERPSSQVSVDDDPGVGDPKAPIQLIEFSDFQCPYCGKARPTIDKILEKYKGKVYYVFRDFPLSFHKEAKDAANAAHCAGDQNKYWEYNKELWKRRPELKNLATLDDIANDLKLDATKFSACRESKKYYKEIDKDQADGANAGVSGTPAYFINGVFLSGAQPFEAFEEVIEEELSKQKKS